MTHIILDQAYTGPRSCRVAYTLNNSQPVTSTLIDDQPMFYMDYSGSEIEDEFLNEKELSILENEVQALQREVQTLERFTQEFTLDSYQKILDLEDDIAFISEPYSNHESSTINQIINTITLSRMGQAYIDFATQHGITISHSHHIVDAEYDRRSGQIHINPQLDQADQILLCVRELRRHWQFRNGALVQPLRFLPDNAVLINRMQAADLAVAMVRIGWELQLGGYKDVWQRLENSSLADLGRAFAREAFKDFRTLNNGFASAAVFEAWFLSERCRIEDKRLIKQMLADYAGYMFDLQESGKAITAALISALGAMPYGKNYLAHHASTIMEDPIFTEVRDRSNANFLWFIKFERSFRETERELQPAFGLAASGVRRSASHQTDQDLHHEHAQTAEIISLFPNAQTGGVAKGDQPAQRLTKSAEPKKGDKKTTAEIVYLRCWSGE